MCLVTRHDILYDVVPYQGDVAVTGEIKAKAIAHGDLIVLFAIGSRTCEVTILRCFVMPIINYCTFGLAPILRTGCKKSICDMHDKVQIVLEGGELVDVLVSEIHNHLDYVKVKIPPP